MTKTKKPTQREVEEFARREVIYCVSMLVYELAKDENYSEDLFPILVQDNWQDAALEAGWSINVARMTGTVSYTHKDSPNEYKIYEGWQDLCEDQGIDPYQNEAYEHWIVSDYLADKLEAKGEMVIRDFLGLTIWGRTCTGQAICMDSVIEDIYKEVKET